MARTKVHLFVIDPQNGFLKPINYTPNLPGGNMNLCVPGGAEDMDRLCKLIYRAKDSIYDMTITLDSHNSIHIATPNFWVDKNGNHPAPFTPITAESVRNGEWRSALFSMQSVALNYVEQLEKNGKFTLVIWPPHCIIGTEGHNVYQPLREATFEWEKSWAIVDFCTKGSNVTTEHYSIFRADVEDANDPSTGLNTRLVSTLEDRDLIIVAGEALSHCVASSLRDFVASVSDPNTVKKIVLLEDCMSSVPGFEQQGIDFINEMKNLGVRIENSTNIL